MQIQRFTCNPFQTNCFVCYDGGQAVLVDPSCSTPDETGHVERFIREHELTVLHLLLTHAHLDHIFGCAHFVERYGTGIQMHRDDLKLLREADEQASRFGVEVQPPPEPGGFLQEGAVVEFGTVSLQVLHTPGHSPGSVSFFDERSGTVLSGDVLFRGSIGRTDLWRGSLPELMRSILQKLVPLGEHVRIYPGHGPETTIGEERRSNPFLTGSLPAG